MKSIFAAAFLTVLLGWSLPAHAQAGDYRVQLTPYVFLAGLNGTIEEKGRSANVNAPFDDILRNSNFIAMIYTDARFGRWRGTLDFLYAEVTSARSTPGPLFSSVTVAPKVWIADPEGGYAIFQGEGKEIDVMAGVRIWGIKNSLTFFRNNVQAELDAGSRTVVDPIIGAHFATDVGRKMFVFGKADIGGFDAAAHLDWQALGGAGYKFNEKVVGTVGYRYLSIDDKGSNSSYDVALKGVILGIGVRF